MIPKMSRSLRSAVYTPSGPPFGWKRENATRIDGKPEVIFTPPSSSNHLKNIYEVERYFKENGGLVNGSPFYQFQFDFAPTHENVASEPAPPAKASNRPAAKPHSPLPPPEAAPGPSRDRNKRPPPPKKVKVASSAAKRGAHGATDDSDSDVMEYVDWKDSLRSLETKIEARDADLLRKFQQEKERRKEVEAKLNDLKSQLEREKEKSEKLQAELKQSKGVANNRKK